jgi:hypothetical protein
MLAVNTQPIEYPVLQIEMSNSECLGLTYVKMYKRLWFTVKVKIVYFITIC